MWLSNLPAARAGRRFAVRAVRSVRELARRAGCSVGLVSQMERGMPTPAAPPWHDSRGRPTRRRPRTARPIVGGRQGRPPRRAGVPARARGRDRGGDRLRDPSPRRGRLPRRRPGHPAPLPQSHRAGHPGRGRSPEVSTGPSGAAQHPSARAGRGERSAHAPMVSSGSGVMPVAAAVRSHSSRASTGSFAVVVRRAGPADPRVSNSPVGPR